MALSSRTLALLGWLYVCGSASATVTNKRRSLRADQETPLLRKLKKNNRGLLYGADLFQPPPTNPSGLVSSGKGYVIVDNPSGKGWKGPSGSSSGKGSVYGKGYADENYGKGWMEGKGGNWGVVCFPDNGAERRLGSRQLKGSKKGGKGGSKSSSANTVDCYYYKKPRTRTPTESPAGVQTAPPTSFDTAGPNVPTTKSPSAGVTTVEPTISPSIGSTLVPSATTPTSVDTETPSTGTAGPTSAVSAAPSGPTTSPSPTGLIESLVPSVSGTAVDTTAPSVSISSAPSSGSVPSVSPTAPSSESVPTVSPAPSAGPPSISPVPSVSGAPTGVPTTSPAPSTTASPSLNITTAPPTPLIVEASVGKPIDSSSFAVVYELPTELTTIPTQEDFSAAAVVVQVFLRDFIFQYYEPNQKVTLYGVTVTSLGNTAEITGTVGTGFDLTATFAENSAKIPSQEELDVLVSEALSAPEVNGLITLLSNMVSSNPISAVEGVSYSTDAVPVADIETESSESQANTILVPVIIALAITFAMAVAGVIVATILRRRRAIRNDITLPKMGMDKEGRATDVSSGWKAPQDWRSEQDGTCSHDSHFEGFVNVDIDESHETSTKLDDSQQNNL